MPKARTVRAQQPPFNKLKQEWYQKLKDSGFEDIENTHLEDHPLIRYHSYFFKRKSREVEVRVERGSGYREKIDSFANDPAFSEIVLLMVRHGNSRFAQEEIESIWQMHRSGSSERVIANSMGCSKSCIHFILERMRAWMRLVV